MKVLVISHAHPDFSVGGAEIAAYNLYKSLKNHEQVTSAFFLARSVQSNLAPGSIMYLRPNEYLWRQEMTDWFRLSSGNIKSFSTKFREFLLLIKPDKIFVHHYAHIGIELLREIRVTLPLSRVILTLHEYLAICNRNGQMVKNKTKRLCYRESIEECHSCFPEKSPEDFWLRKHYIQKHFEFVDAFVAPSHFLKERYVAWGLPPEHTYVIENGQDNYIESYIDSSDGYYNRFGFFGQITEYKGVDIFLQAIHHVDKTFRSGLNFEVHGANLDLQGLWFQELIGKLKDPLIAEGTLRWVGPYEPSELQRRMRHVGWVVVPSIWWENSPMVIQEAFVAGKPVICAGIGGMREKVRNNVDGLHFEVGNPLDLAETIYKAATNPDLHKKLTASIKKPKSHDDCTDSYLLLN